MMFTSQIRQNKEKKCLTNPIVRVSCRKPNIFAMKAISLRARQKSCPEPRVNFNYFWLPPQPHFPEPRNALFLRSSQESHERNETSSASIRSSGEQFSTQNAQVKSNPFEWRLRAAYFRIARTSYVFMLPAIPLESPQPLNVRPNIRLIVVLRKSAARRSRAGWKNMLQIFIIFSPVSFSGGPLLCNYAA